MKKQTFLSIVYLCLAGLGFVLYQTSLRFRYLPSQLQYFFQQPYRNQSIKQLTPLINSLTPQEENKLINQLKTRLEYLNQEKDWQEAKKSLLEIEKKNQQINQEINHLKKLNQKYQNYPALKILLAILEYHQGHHQTAIMFLNQAKKLDPNNPLIPQLEKLMK